MTEHPVEPSLRIGRLCRRNSRKEYPLLVGRIIRNVCLIFDRCKNEYNYITGTAQLRRNMEKGRTDSTEYGLVPVETHEFRSQDSYVG
jgi:hypothetical protein